MHINRDLNVSDIIWGIAMQKNLRACKGKVFNFALCYKYVNNENKENWHYTIFSVILVKNVYTCTFLSYLKIMICGIFNVPV